MRIVHVITRLIIGGAQENTLLTCRGQIERGHAVWLLSGPTAGPEGSMVDRARRQAGLAFEVVPDMTRNVRPWRDGRAFGQLRSRLAELRPDVVHTHSSKAGILGRQAAAKACPDALVVHTIHGLPFYPGQWPFVRQFLVRLERRAARQTDHFISVCDAMTAEALDARIAPPEKFTTVYSGMEVQRFLQPDEPIARVRRQYDLPAEATVVIKVARLFRRKGHDDVLRAFAEIADGHPTLYLFFVGDGVLRASIERLAARLGVQRRLRMAGLVDPDRVAPLIHASDILVHASMREGLARVLPQALLSGRPAISYDVGGAREVVHTGETGILVAPGDWRGLARALDAMASDRAMRQRMGERGRALCVERFDHERMVDGILSAYDKALQRKRTAG
jgi:glycosyltransferase involved in cell wall biosynthesis